MDKKKATDTAAEGIQNLYVVLISSGVASDR